jgi:hypothetical protein
VNRPTFSANVLRSNRWRWGGSGGKSGAPGPVPVSGSPVMCDRASWRGRSPLGQTRGRLAAAVLVAGAVLAGDGWSWAETAAAAGAAAAAPQYKLGDACPIPGRITAADGSLRGFVPAHHFYLEVDGKEAPAELYNIGAKAVLVISPSLPYPVVIKALTVAAVPPGKIEKKADGTLDVRPDAAVLQTLSPATATYDTVSFAIGGHSQVLRTRPPLDFLRAPKRSSPQRP